MIKMRTIGVIGILLCVFLLQGCGKGILPAGSQTDASTSAVAFDISPPLPPPAQPIIGKMTAPPPVKFNQKSALAGKSTKVEVRKDAGSLQYTLSAGWNTISFPFDSLTSLNGFGYFLFYWDGSQYQILNPADAGSTDCSKGFWAYANSSTTVTATGNYSGNFNAITLHAGWNFFAFPQRDPLVFSNITLTYGGETKTLAQASSHNYPLPSSAWVYGWVLYYRDNQWYYLRCEKENNTFNPWQGYWLWSRVDGAVLSFVNNPNALFPHIDYLSSYDGIAGDTLTITGSHFATTPSENIVTFGGITATVSQCSDFQIICSVPNGVVGTQDVIVSVNNQASNAVDFAGSIPGGNTEIEMNNDFTHAQILQAGSYSNFYCSDYDYFKVYLNTGQTMSINMTANTYKGIWLYDANLEYVYDFGGENISINPYQATQSGYYYLCVFPYQLDSYYWGAYNIDIQLGEGSDQEPNNDFTHAQILQAGSYSNFYCSDYDYFKVYLNTGQTMSINMTANTYKGIWLYDANLEYVYDFGGENISINPYQATQSGYYYLCVFPYHLDSYYWGAYDLEINIPTTGTVTGKITDSDNGLGISGATVSVSTTGGEISDTTDSSGNYTLSNVPAGNYSVLATKSGYVGNSKGCTVAAGGTVTVNISLSVP